MGINSTNRLSFGQIAVRWAQEPETYPCEARLTRPLANVTDGLAETVALEELIASTWRGEFERSGESALTLPWAEGSKRLHDRWADLMVIGHRPPKQILNPESGKMEEVKAPILAPTISPPHIKITRDDLREALRQSNWCSPDIAMAEFKILANLPIDFYSSLFRETCLECISITKDAFRQWCEWRDLDRPAFWFGPSDQSRNRVSEKPHRSPRSHDPLENEALKNRIEKVLAIARRKWRNPQKRPPIKAMARELVRENGKEFGYKFSAVHQILAGTYPASKRLGIGQL